MIPGARLVILGRQGAGKGTQCVRLSQHYVIPHISTGDMLRVAVGQGTDMGQKAKEYMDAGRLLPDDVIIGIVEERLAQEDTKRRGWLLDGFPRTIGQAKALDELGDRLGQSIDLVVDISVPTEICIERMQGRARPDDTADAITERLRQYEEQTVPVIGFYEEKGLLETVDGLGTPVEVEARIRSVVDRRILG